MIIHQYFAVLFFVASDVSIFGNCFIPATTQSHYSSAATFLGRNKVRSSNDKRIKLFGSSPSVNNVADKDLRAREALQKLEDDLKSRSEAYKNVFDEQISQSFAASEITDAFLLEENTNIKVEFSNEFDIDVITNVVTETVKSAAGALSSDGAITKKSVLQPEAIEGYVSLVTAIGELARARSDSSSSFSFSYKHLGPGWLSCISCTSISIKDETVFGSEALTFTSYLHKIFYSEDDLRRYGRITQVTADVAFLLETDEQERQSIRDFQKIRSGLIEKVATDNLSFEEFVVKDSFFSGQIAKLQAAIDDRRIPKKPTNLIVQPSQAEVVNPNYNLINMDMKRESWMKDKENLALIKHYKAQTLGDPPTHTAVARVERFLKARVRRNFFSKLPADEPIMNSKLIKVLTKDNNESHTKEVKPKFVTQDNINSPAASDTE